VTYKISASILNVLSLSENLWTFNETLNNGICEILDVRENVKPWIYNFYNSRKDHSKPILAQKYVPTRSRRSFTEMDENSHNFNETLLLDVAINPLISALIGIELNEIEVL